MHFAFNFPLEKIIFLKKNIIKYDKSWFFLLIIWDGGSIMHCPYQLS